jgi:CRISPR-associated protein (TIGR03986 family)
MATGTITSWRKKSKNGKIKPDDGGKELNFGMAQLLGVAKSEAKRVNRGMLVSFTLNEKERIDTVQLVEGLPEAEAKTKAKPSDALYRFLNPYNFVRLLPAPGGGHLLGRCPPPPHDRYVGLTGQIRCTLKAVTPLFIADSEEVQEVKVDKPRQVAAGEEAQEVKPDKIHLSLRFFRVNDQPALPATSLRGAVRSLFEAATNSCFAVFDHEMQLEHRLDPSYGNQLEAGIVVSLPQAAKDSPPAQEGEIILCKVAKVGAYYEGRKGSRNVLFRDKRDDGEPWKCGDRAVARVTTTKSGPRVEELAERVEDLRPLGAHESYVDGWLKITGQGIDTKNNEFFFIDPHRYGAKGRVKYIFSQMEDYNIVLAGQFERDGFRTRYQSRQLEEGNLVWVAKSKQYRGRAERVLGVKVPRVRYGRPLGKLLPPAGHRCEQFNELCPACRVFGWVHEEAPEDMGIRVAYAGRVRFSMGQIEGSYRSLGSVALAILSTPKPTTTRFYLIHKDGQARGWHNERFINRPNDPRFKEVFGEQRLLPEEQGRSDQLAGPDGPNILRGRKFYRHHGEGLRKENYTKPGDQAQKHSNQNRTLRDPLQPGATFTFTVKFANLAPIELGALLWSLEMEGWHHRLGMGKPLGFGSVRIAIQDEGTWYLDRTARYKSIEACPDEGRDDGLQALNAGTRRWLIEQFKNAMLKQYAQPAQSFLDLANIADIKALLSTAAPLPVHYPRPMVKAQAEGKNYEWFEGNTRAGKGTYGPRLELPVAGQEASPAFDGLPILNDDGNEVLK